MKKRALIVTAHPLEQIIGCGGATARYAERDTSIEVVVVSNELSLYDPSRKVRADRVTDIHAGLGIANTRFLEFSFNLPQTRFAGLTKKLAEAIAEIAASEHLDMVFLPHASSASKSVNLTAEAVMMAVSAQTVQTIYAYEIPTMPGEHQSGYPIRFSPNVFVDIGQQLPKKLDAAAAGAALTLSQTYSRESIEALARLRGQNVGLQAAEGFVLVRHVEP